MPEYSSQCFDPYSIFPFMSLIHTIIGSLCLKRVIDENRRKATENKLDGTKDHKLIPIQLKKIGGGYWFALRYITTNCCG
jgi:hypothetical protein